MPKFHRNEATVTAEQWRRQGDLTTFMARIGRLITPYVRDGVLPTQPCEFCSGHMQNHAWISPPLPPVDPAIAVTTVNPVTGEPTPALAAKEYPVTYEKVGTTDQAVVHNQEEREHAVREGFTPVVVEAPVTAPYRAEQSAGFGNPSMRREFPKTYKKDGTPDRTVNNQDEQDLAVTQGYQRDITLPTEPVFTPAAGFTRQAPEVYPSAPSPKADSERQDLNGLPVCPGDWVCQDDVTKEVFSVKNDLFVHQFTKVF